MLKNEQKLEVVKEKQKMLKNTGSNADRKIKF